MKKQVFLARVRETLLQNGLRDQVVERQIRRLSEYIDAEGGENAEAMLDDEDPVLLAEEICMQFRRNAARRRAAEAVVGDAAIDEDAAEKLPEQPEPQEQPLAEPAAPPQPEQQGEENVPVVLPKPADAAPVMRTREIRLVPPRGNAVDFVDLPQVSVGVETQPGADYMGAARTAGRQTTDVFSAVDLKRDDGMLEVDDIGSRAVEYAGEPGGPLFWVLFCVSLPFLAVLGLAVLSLFVAAFAALAALMVASIAALAVVAAVGTAFTLVALVYGIVQMLSTLPIGLYEFGIGIVAGAAVLFCSILLYNLAIRLLPFAIRQLGRFFGWTVKRLKLLFIYVKGACAKL